MALLTRCQLICVEGNISAGKSTLCKELAERLDYELFLEPVLTNPYIERYYADPGTFALPMQLWLLRQRFLTYCLALRLASRPGSKAKGVIMDRSIFSDIVFALKNREDENIDAAGYAEYEALRAGLLALIPLPHAVVYLDVSAEACHDRVLSMRQRECESGIPLAYLEGLDRCYKKFCVDMQDSGVDVLSFDWEQFGDVTPVADGVMELRSAAAERAGWPLVQEDESEHKDAWVDIVATDESIVGALARFETPKDTLDIAVGSDSDALRDLVSQMQAHNAVELTSVVDNLQTPPKALRKGDRVGEIDSPEPADSPSSVLAGP